MPILDKPAYQLCRHSKPSGCEVYEARPQECRDYSCLWLSDELGEVADRPDAIGVVFDRPSLVADHEDYRGVPFVCAREMFAGAREGARAADLLRRFARTWVVRLTSPDGRTQLTGPESLVQLLVSRARSRADAGSP